MRKSDFHILTLETTCDETAAAIVSSELKVLGAVVASQEELHRRFGGVVPELASRAHVERILPVIAETLQKSNLSLSDLDGVAVATTPGLAGSLLVGLMAAKTLAFSLNIPLIAVDHLQAHIYACRMSAEKNVFPCVGLVVSGGHTSLFDCHSATEFELLGSTIDDAAGEAFDKVASMLGLSYPGGPSIQRAAEAGDADTYAFPRAFIRDTKTLDFSFSGLKTAVRYQLTGPGGADFSSLKIPAQKVANIAASFQAAVVDCVVAKSVLGLEKTGYSRLCVGGGVAANAALRAALSRAAGEGNWELITAPLSLCTDNAIMGAIAVEKLQEGVTESLDLGIRPGLVRKNTSNAGL
ncbi:MAG: tRNA (adenosine(37)-N6)-threonylcarbamoyltransferase complex transferase subunit TsaD [Planctomycetaceae bacterium]|nr:tRNA (adenosine(37)-N6)-threonylcarbamoyltransferase complex transferase subunit TsaD [Planctomycetaceae bacterium]